MVKDLLGDMSGDGPGEPGERLVRKAYEQEHESEASPGVRRASALAALCSFTRRDPRSKRIQHNIHNGRAIKILQSSFPLCHDVHLENPSSALLPSGDFTNGKYQ